MKNKIKIGRTSDLVNLTNVYRSLIDLGGEEPDGQLSDEAVALINKIENVYYEIGFEVNGEDVKKASTKDTGPSEEERIESLNKLNA